MPWHLAFTHQTLVDGNGIKLTKVRNIHYHHFFLCPPFLVIWLRGHKGISSIKWEKKRGRCQFGGQTWRCLRPYPPPTVVNLDLFIPQEIPLLHLKLHHNSLSLRFYLPLDRRTSVPLFQENTQPCIGFYSQSVTNTCLPFLHYPIQAQWAQ